MPSSADGPSCPSAGRLHPEPPAAFVPFRDSVKGRSVLSGMRQAMGIVRGITLCFVVALSLSSPALSSSRFMPGKFNSLGIIAPSEYGRTTPKRLAIGILRLG